MRYNNVLLTVYLSSRWVKAFPCFKATTLTVKKKKSCLALFFPLEECLPTSPVTVGAHVTVTITKECCRVLSISLKLHCSYHHSLLKKVKEKMAF